MQESDLYLVDIGISQRFVRVEEMELNRNPVKSLRSNGAGKNPPPRKATDGRSTKQTRNERFIDHRQRCRRFSFAQAAFLFGDTME